MTFKRSGLSDLIFVTSHDHTIAQVTGLQAALNGKQASLGSPLLIMRPIQADILQVVVMQRQQLS